MQGRQGYFLSDVMERFGQTRLRGPFRLSIPCQNKLMSKGSSIRQGIGLAFRLGTELVVATMIGALMGYAMDNYFDTKPWGILAGLIFGAAAGCLTVYRTAMNLKFDDEEENNGDQPPKGEDS